VLRIAGNLSEAATVRIDNVAASVDGANHFTGTKTLASGTNTFAVTATDASGNSQTKTYQVDAAGANRTFTYDANGNLTSDGTRTFEWDVENRLLAVNSGTHRSEFTYDGLDRRVRMIEKESGAIVRDAYVFWAGTQIIEERLSTGEINRFFDDGEQHNGSARYLTRDHLGSIREVTDSAGAVVTRNDYDPYGRVTRVAGTEDSRFGYTGHIAHGPSGLALALYRAYDPGLGRWLSEDPAGMVDGPNKFAYISNQPISSVDVLGLQSCAPSNGPADQDRGRSPRRNDPDGMKELLEGIKRRHVEEQLKRLERMEAGAPDARRLAMKAIDIIAKELKGSVHSEFPKEMYEKTLEQITNLAKQGDKAAQTARKLLTQKAYKK
jgi:RHS repeat-associated protein